MGSQKLYTIIFLHKHENILTSIGTLIMDLHHQPVSLVPKTAPSCHDGVERIKAVVAEGTQVHEAVVRQLAQHVWMAGGWPVALCFYFARLEMNSNGTESSRENHGQPTMRTTNTQ